jgi:uncharacterized protein
MPEDLAVLIADFAHRRVWAVVGASADPNKYGHRIFKTLLSAGYRVYGINPNTTQVDGQTLYPTLAALPEPPDVVDLVVPPKVGLGIVQECDRLGLRRIWLQPGAESDDIIHYCEEHGLAVVHHACAMVYRYDWPDAPTAARETTS